MYPDSALRLDRFPGPPDLPDEGDLDTPPGAEDDPDEEAEETDETVSLADELADLLADCPEIPLLAKTLPKKTIKALRLQVPAIPPIPAPTLPPRNPITYTKIRLWRGMVCKFCNVQVNSISGLLFLEESRNLKTWKKIDPAAWHCDTTARYPLIDMRDGQIEYGCCEQCELTPSPDLKNLPQFLA